MSLGPLLTSSPVIQLHAFAAMSAFVLGLVQFTAPKGTLPHRTIGWIWVGLMAVISISSFWIHGIRMIGPFSPIHALSIFTLVMLPLAVLHAHKHRVMEHRKAMISIFVGALIVAGAFTFLPGRVMHAVAFGN
ncbi:MAG TPA: DUF2306 domain-containing protein [Xanthobacteraceae bacterium]|jgi:uncharacterized membrane protein|nr:DUF2306 domain-containing protein [Xanthobacteraceae bacterium]